MTARTSTTHRLTARPGELTAGEITAFAAALSPELVVTIRMPTGDRPGDVGVITFEATAPLEPRSHQPPPTAGSTSSRPDYLEATR